MKPPPMTTARSSLLDEFVGALFHGEGVFHGAKREDASVVYAGKVGLDGFRAGGKDEAVVGFLVFQPVFEVADKHGFRRAVYSNDLLAYAYVDIEALTEAFGALQRELALVRNDVAHVIGQAAVGVRHVARAFDHDYFGLLV